MRDNKIQQINSIQIVPGNIIYLNVGDIVPADIRIIESKNLATNEAILTGESLPITKNSKIKAKSQDIPQKILNGLFMGTSIISGSATGIVLYTGKNTFLGKTIAISDTGNLETNFQKSLKRFSNILLQVVIFLTIFIFIVNALLDRGIITSFLFGATLAIGITPEILPIIVTIAISNAAYHLSKNHVIIRRLAALEDLGNVDVLCSDKTGTVTEGILSLEKYLTLDNKQEEQILKYGIICNAFNPISKNKLLTNPIDETIWNAKNTEKLKVDMQNIQLVDFHDFDFEQKTMSVLINNKEDNNILITKGATETIINLSKRIIINNKEESLNKVLQKKLQENIKNFGNSGYRIISIAYKKTSSNKITQDNLHNLTYLGMMLFIDPVKKTLKQTFAELKAINVDLKIITGDSPIITCKICNDAQLKIVDEKILIGDDLENRDEEKLKQIVSHYNVFARISPEQKYKIITALKSGSHVVGYLGDGINDVAALKVADVGISVNSGVDVAKNSADIILLKRDLTILTRVIMEGRKTFGNTIKFIINTMSSSYGNVLTIAISSLFLKFIPLLPTQLLLIDSLSDAQHLTVSTDNVDAEFLQKPRKLGMRFFRKFIIFFGTISTIFDFLLIVVLVSRHNTPEAFRTVWFIESVFSEIIATFSTRTPKTFFRSIPSIPVIITSLIVAIITIVIPFTIIGWNIFEFTKVGIESLLFIAIILVLYFIILEVGKKIFYRKFEYI